MAQLSLKKLIAKMLSVSTTTNAVYLRDGSTTGTAKATGTQTTKIAGRVHDIFINIPMSNITISSYGVITGVVGLPSGVKFPASLNIQGAKYAAIALQNSSDGIYIRGDIDGTMANPKFTTDANGALHARYVWVA